MNEQLYLLFNQVTGALVLYRQTGVTGDWTSFTDPIDIYERYQILLGRDFRRHSITVSEYLQDFLYDAYITIPIPLAHMLSFKDNPPTIDTFYQFYPEYFI